MTAVLDHDDLARLIDGAAGACHDSCELCSTLDLRRQLHGLAEQIRAVNNTPHPAPKPAPKPSPPAPPKPGGK